jgi:hypothetical protein
MDLTQLKLGQEMQIHVHDGSSITLTPVRGRSSKQEMSQIIQSTVNDYSSAMRRTL